VLSRYSADPAETGLQAHGYDSGVPAGYDSTSAVGALLCLTLTGYHWCVNRQGEVRTVKRDKSGQEISSWNWRTLF
jgi:hypothetical protein